MQKLTPFQEKLIKLRLSGKSLLEISEHTGRRYGTVRNDFMLIYRALRIRLGCELAAAFTLYEINHNKITPSVRQMEDSLETL